MGSLVGQHSAVVAVGFQNKPPQDVPLCQADFFELEATIATDSRETSCLYLTGVSSLWPAGQTMALNLVQHKIVNLLKTFFFFCSSVFLSVCVFNTWPKTTLLFPVWPKNPKGWTPLIGREAPARCGMRWAGCIFSIICDLVKNGYYVVILNF